MLPQISASRRNSYYPDVESSINVRSKIQAEKILTLKKNLERRICPNCRKGRIETGFTFTGELLALMFFPCGILCCFLMREQRCKSCDYVV